MGRDATSDGGFDPVDLPRHPRGYAEDLPVSGAWRPGDPEGDRRFIELAVDRPFVLEGGDVLSHTQS